MSEKIKWKEVKGKGEGGGGFPGAGGKTDMRGKLTRICFFPNEINPMCNRWCSVKCCSMYFCFNVSKMHQEGKKRVLMLVQERRKKKKRLR